MKKIIYILIFTLLVIGCEKEKLIDVLPQLKIIVEDENKSKISNANITLYKSLNDWSESKNMVISKKTDVNGIIVFQNLEETKYYFYIEKGDKSNKYGIATTTEKLKLNELKEVTVQINNLKK